MLLVLETLERRLPILFLSTFTSDAFIFSERSTILIPRAPATFPYRLYVRKLETGAGDKSRVNSLDRW